ncbi:uncharacterized protein [Parasteatoda tepidariorum]|uniref:uncharacterized protein n=1 Tax=Parasteatoda tepidariorum TaxID=114398 RepID=UPI00077F81A1|nr:uncharacterized protein LOC107448790 [Parasteatoda tepidariorum]
MTYKLSSDNVAYQLRRGQKDLLGPPISSKKDCFNKEILITTHRADFKAPPKLPPPEVGKKRQLMERYLFEKISRDIAQQEFRPASPPNYLSTTHEHFDVPGFDPDAGLRPTFEYSLYLDPTITYWSENKRNIHGVTVSNNPTPNFNYSSRFSKPVGERWVNALTHDVNSGYDP